MVALERGEQRALFLVEKARREERQLTVPAAVLAEWWHDDARQRYLRSLLTVEDTTEEIARRAGVALGSPRRAARVLRLSPARRRAPPSG